MKYLWTVKKSRVEHTCSHCGKVIPIGSPYSWTFIVNTVDKLIKCDECGNKFRLKIEISDRMAINSGAYSEDDIDYLLDPNDDYEVGCAAEANELGCFEILNMEFHHTYDKELNTRSDGYIILNDGFDIGFATEQLDQYFDYVNEQSDTVPMYYTELMRRNDYLGDDAAFDYAGSYMMVILDIINWALENGAYEEVE